MQTLKWTSAFGNTKYLRQCELSQENKLVESIILWLSVGLSIFLYVILTLAINLNERLSVIESKCVRVSILICF